MMGIQILLLSSHSMMILSAVPAVFKLKYLTQDRSKQQYKKNNKIILINKLLLLCGDFEDKS